MNPIVAYLKDGELPEDKLEARRLQARSTWSCLYDDKLYKRGFSVPLLRCMDDVDCQAVLVIMLVQGSVAIMLEHYHWHRRHFDKSFTGLT